jgi:hypothetical protein
MEKYSFSFCKYVAKGTIAEFIFNSIFSIPESEVFCLLLSFSVVLGIELRILCLLGQPSTT